MTTQLDVLDAELIAIDGVPVTAITPVPDRRCGVDATRGAGPHQSEGPAMTPHVDNMAAPERVAADVAILAVATAVANAAQHLVAARTAIVEMEIALAEYNSRDGQCVCGCS